MNQIPIWHPAILMPRIAMGPAPRNLTMPCCDPRTLRLGSPCTQGSRSHWLLVHKAPRYTSGTYSHGTQVPTHNTQVKEPQILSMSHWKSVQHPGGLSSKLPIFRSAMARSSLAGDVMFWQIPKLWIIWQKLDSFSYREIVIHELSILNLPIYLSKRVCISWDFIFVFNFIWIFFSRENFTDRTLVISTKKFVSIEKRT